MLTDYFDNEPTPGGQYEKVATTNILDDDGITRRIVKRFRGRLPGERPPERVSVALEERRNGDEGVLVRYDNAHGTFHRHAPGWPEPGAEDATFPHVSSSNAAAVAKKEILAWYHTWEAQVFGQEGEDLK